MNLDKKNEYNRIGFFFWVLYFTFVVAFANEYNRIGLFFWVQQLIKISRLISPYSF